jgi:hypothetical protein
MTINYSAPFLSLLVLVWMSTACTSDNIQSETSDTKIPTGIDSLASRLSSYDKNVQALIQDPNGLVRGFNLTMEGSVVKAKNATLQLVDSTNNTYSTQLDPVEAADYSFQITENKLSKIEVVIYPENEYRQGIYYRELKDYYSAKYKTKAKEEGNSLSWEIPSQELSIRLSKVGSKKIHDVQLVFEILK